MFGEAHIEALIQSIYEAATGAIGWASFLVSLGGALDATLPVLYLADTENRGGSMALCVGLDESDVRAYGEYYAARNIWIQGAQAKGLLNPGLVRSSRLMCSRREFLQSEWYADFCRPLGFVHGIGATVLEDDGVTSNIGVFADRNRVPYGEGDENLIGALIPHLQRGLRMHLHLAASQSRNRALEAVLHGLSAPVLLVTAEGRVLFMNSAAERLIRASDGLLVEGGELRALLPNDTKSLCTLIAGAAQTSAREGRKSGGTLRVSRPYAREPLDLLISPLPSRCDGWILKQPPVAAVFVTDRSGVPVAEDSLLIRLHGLTAMEAKVAVAVSRGLSGKEICRELEISYNTLKTHLKHIYAKTRTKHQSDLVRLLAGSLQIVRTGESERS